MAIDMTQFHQTFLEESFEGLDHMEQSLLALGDVPGDSDVVHGIFRAAHSIKGGSATFGFKAVAEFTHLVETLLDQLRSGERTIEQPLVDVLLRSVDVIRGMLEAARAGGEPNLTEAQTLRTELESLLNRSPVVVAPSTTEVDAGVPPGAWLVRFRPHAHLMQRGNDPVRLLRELASMGKFTATADLSRLPAFHEMDPEQCYIGWDLSLAGPSESRAIMDVFDWVDGDCDIDVRAASCEDRSTDPVAPGAATPAQADATGRPSPERHKTADAGSIRVGIDKVDALINMVGELVITQSMLGELGAGLDDFDNARADQLRDGLAQLERNTRELQESVMRIRMLPISFAFNRLPRLVHDLSTRLNKKVQLRLSGEQTELDKTVMEKIGDPLVHLVRNALDHGVEDVETRREAGKTPTATVHLNAFHKGGNIVIEISDDGRGLDAGKILDKARERGLVGAQDNPPQEQIFDLIFEPGFSTAASVSDVSGRGVGMDVVRRNIKELGGAVEVSSCAGEGTTFVIRLPLTLAILDGQLVQVTGQTYVVPLVSIVESLQIKPELVNQVAGQSLVYKLRDEYVPMIRLAEVFNLEPAGGADNSGLLVVVEGENQKIGLMVDDLLSQQQVVIKSLEMNYQRVPGVSGATILGDGTVALILDVGALVNISKGGRRGRAGNRDDRVKAA
ncbi:MAG: chemotaxis protein CheA [Gammaproteobacteria bacterium]